MAHSAEDTVDVVVHATAHVVHVGPEHIDHLSDEF